MIGDSAGYTTDFLLPALGSSIPEGLCSHFGVRRQMFIFQAPLCTVVGALDAPIGAMLLYWPHPSALVSFFGGTNVGHGPVRTFFLSLILFLVPAH